MSGWPFAAILAMMESDIDFWEIIRPLLPLLKEIERIEAKAAGKTDLDDSSTDGQSEKDDQGPEGGEINDG